MPPTNRPAKPQVKLSKARLMYSHSETPRYTDWIAPSRLRFGKVGTPALVLPFRSPAQAKRALKFWGMTEEERAEVMAKKMYEDVEGGHAYGWVHEVMTEEVKEGWRESARVILSLITGGQKP